MITKLMKYSWIGTPIAGLMIVAWYLYGEKMGLPSTAHGSEVFVHTTFLIAVAGAILATIADRKKVPPPWRLKK